MKFIRKNGRVIPIHDSSEARQNTLTSASRQLRVGAYPRKQTTAEAGHRAAVVKGAAGQGVGMGVVGVGAVEALAHAHKAAAKAAGKKFAMTRGMRGGLAVMSVGYGTMLGSAVYQAVQQHKANKIHKLDRVERRKENGKQLAAMYGGMAAVGLPYLGIGKFAHKAKPAINAVAGLFRKRAIKDVKPWQPLRLTK